jgi:hypothetical protein
MGWTLVHKIEADSTGKDKYARQTCDVSTQCSMFLPAGLKPDENKVHVFFTPNGVTGNVLNAVTCHALREAAAPTDWILVAVLGDDANPPLITAKKILDFLDSHGRPRRIDKMRFGCHSRGLFSLAASLNSKKLVAKSPTAPVLDPSIVERVVTFDEADVKTNKDTGVKRFILQPALQFAGIDLAKMFGFYVGVPTWSIPPNQTVNLTNTRETRAALRVVEYCRLIEDAKVVNPGVTIPPDIDAIITSLHLPPLGSFTSRSSPTAPLVDFRDWAKTNNATIKATGIEDETVQGKLSKLYKFVDKNDLAHLYQVPTSKRFPPVIYGHHLVVSEFVHEVTDAAAPQP